MEVEKGVFTSLVFSTTGGMGTEAERFYKRIAEKTAWRTGQKYHETIGYIHKKETSIRSIKNDNNSASRHYGLDAIRKKS